MSSSEKHILVLTEYLESEAPGTHGVLSKGSGSDERVHHQGAQGRGAL